MDNHRCVTAISYSGSAEAADRTRGPIPESACAAMVSLRVNVEARRTRFPCDRRAGRFALGSALHVTADEGFDRLVCGVVVVLLRR